MSSGHVCSLMPFVQHSLCWKVGEWLTPHYCFGEIIATHMSKKNSAMAACLHNPET